MKRHRQFNKDIKYTPKSYNNLLPYDVVELLIARRDKTKVSDEVLADKIGIYAWKLKALLKRKIYRCSLADDEWGKDNLSDFERWQLAQANMFLDVIEWIEEVEE